MSFGKDFNKRVSSRSTYLGNVNNWDVMQSHNAPNIGMNSNVSISSNISVNNSNNTDNNSIRPNWYNSIDYDVNNDNMSQRSTISPDTQILNIPNNNEYLSDDIDITHNNLNPGLNYLNSNYNQSYSNKNKINKLNNKMGYKHHPKCMCLNCKSNNTYVNNNSFNTTNPSIRMPQFPQLFSNNNNSNNANNSKCTHKNVSLPVSIYNSQMNAMNSNNYIHNNNIPNSNSNNNNINPVTNMNTGNNISPIPKIPFDLLFVVPKHPNFMAVNNINPSQQTNEPTANMEVSSNDPNHQNYTLQNFNQNNQNTMQDNNLLLDVPVFIDSQDQNELQNMIKKVSKMDFETQNGQIYTLIDLLLIDCKNNNDNMKQQLLKGFNKTKFKNNANFKPNINARNDTDFDIQNNGFDWDDVNCVSTIDVLGRINLSN